MAVTIGEFELTVVSGGRLRLDGGTMFGLVPKALWERKSPADERNRIPLDTNCLVARVGGKTLLIDTGCGAKADTRQRDQNALDDGDPLRDNLAKIGLKPQDIDMVILTHLHFDHAGGCTFLDSDGVLRPTFPQATHIIQRTEWEDATGNLPELVGAYPPEHFMPLQEAGLIELIDDGAEPLPGVTCRVTGGHTRGHQVVHLESGGQHAVYLGDLCPTRAHLRTFWHMSYDQFPLDVRRTKPKVLGEAADRGWIVVFDHDPKTPAVRLKRDPKHEFVVSETVEVGIAASG